ncbi:unnamed protein product [Parnassius apollo]|uniref:ubiquitinyl hydrolase 1 n=1 Tax=Parnassius apollo TaxID=110799 RepID=A0A8S3WLV5_PARAO|nr:unnamed protein product [Parnassius apollo]
MGAKDSKPSFISYEDATKRVSDSELRRIREAFKRCAGTNGTALSLEAFVHEVLCDGVPFEVAEWLYQACGGTKRGIAFKDLLCGIVVLTKGNIEEKIKFLWTLYVNNQSENGAYIYKRDFARALQLENTSLSVAGEQRTADILTSLFGHSERVTFEQFRSWLLIHKDATVLSKWLLSDRGSISHDLETPTFYQSLAGVTHLEERDIIELEKWFWSLRNKSVSGQLDAESLAPLLSPPLPRAAVAGVLRALDENRDGHVDFKELCCGLSAAGRGPRAERLKFCFKIFDLDGDGILNKKEIIDMVEILCTVANESLKYQSSRASTPSDNTESEGDKDFDPEVVLLNLRDKLVTVSKNGKKPVFQLGPNNDGDEILIQNKVEEELLAIKEDRGSSWLLGADVALTAEDFLIWSVESAARLVRPLLELLFDVCHVTLGLRPHCRHHEHDIVIRWMQRETARGYAVGQFWYLVGSEWWAAWLAHCAAPAACCRAPPRPPSTPCPPYPPYPPDDDSFTTNSTESMGSLLWRAESASLGSGGSSGSGGSAGSSSGIGSAPVARASHPGPVDNRRLLAPDHLKVRTLTGEGGLLRRDVTLAQHRDFELLPDALWRALALWYGGPDPLPRQVIRPPNSDVEIELYPLQLKILRHVLSTQRVGVGASAVGAGPGAALYSSVPAAPERQLAYTAAFSRLATVKQVSEFLCQALGLAREDVRLWSVSSSGAALLLDDERPTLQELGMHERDRSRLLLELRNSDLTWPEEIGALSASGGLSGLGSLSALGGLGGRSARGVERRETLAAPDVAGATGLHNLGNTCFMNAALQAVWNTGPLTRYFNSGMHLYEVNTTNPLGTKGALALRYGELCKESDEGAWVVWQVWSSSARSVAPLRVRWCVSRHARALAGGGQHDAQELLAWLLDALHEDLNRTTPAPAATLAPAPAPAPVPPPRPDQSRSNFCASEKGILIELILKYKDVVENKKTDAVTIAHKNEGWKVLTEEFNSLSSFNVRNTDQLRTCWDNLKRTTRKDKAATKKEIFLTGGGRPNHPPPGPLQEQVEILLGPTLDGLANEFDSDGQFQESVTASNKVKEDSAEILPNIVLLDAVPGCSTVIEQVGSSGLNSSQGESGELNKETFDGSSRREVQEIAAEAWEQFTSRNRSIMTDLFYGQLKSKVRCDTCGHESVRFDTFNMLSLPLPMESFVRCEVRVILLDGSVPVKYGVRVNSDGTYLDLKKKLSELCGLPPECMVVAEVAGAAGARLLADGARLGAPLAAHAAQPAAELFAYEIPSPSTYGWSEGGVALGCDGCEGDGECGEGGGGAGGGSGDEVSVRPRASSSLCMPALFCFKRSRSEILMSQSPPNTFYKNNDYRSLTLPKRTGSSSPTPSLRSLNLPPPSTGLPKIKFASSPSDMYKMDAHTEPEPPMQYLVAVHRKQCRADAYFLAWQRVRPALFGVPLLVALRAGEPGRQLYARVWAQLARLLSPRPPPTDLPNHAADCDDSLGYEVPFTLRAVSGDGAWCALCAWPALCRGCALPSDGRPLLAPAHADSEPVLHIDAEGGGARHRHHSARLSADIGGECAPGEVSYLDMNALRAARRRGLMLAIDWEPTALHLRYQASRERACHEHPSVAAVGRAAARAVDLRSCLAAFTSQERLEQRYHCDACRSAQPATKKLQIWRAPPVLIIHLKRFQYVNNKWIKSQKVVNFPFEDFDPTPYLASVPQETILRHRELKNMRRHSSMFVDVDDRISESESEESDDEDETQDSSPKENSRPITKTEKKRKESVEVTRRTRLESTSLMASPVTDDNLIDYHQHYLEKDQDPFDLKYKLYAVVSHSGQLHGGHYVAHAHNPSGAWLCYNDSSCREVDPHAVDPAAAYLLFYERRGLRYERYMPDVAERSPVRVDLPPEDADLRNMCVLT